jgi:hypothetical protein
MRSRTSIPVLSRPSTTFSRASTPLPMKPSKATTITH